MDNHPIPQDVTNFQFRLIGDMTLKQFAYLAAGAGAAWIAFVLPFSFFLKFPLVILFGGMGVLLAFVPIEGRPADTMMLFFFKSLFSPTQYVYQQAGGTLPPPTPPDEKVVIKQEPEESKNDERKEQTVHLDSPVTPLDPTILQSPTTNGQKEMPIAQASTLHAQIVTGPMGGDNSSPQALGNEAAELVKEIQEAKQEETKVPEGTQEAAAAHEKVAQLEDELQTILKQKQELEKQLLELEKQLAAKKQQVFTPSASSGEPQETSHVIKVAPNQKASVGTPLTNDVPNLMSGVVKDPRGNVLPNILIEVKDKDNNPVRAFKTNPLGQFASATPVISGVYTITFEDPQGKNKFDTVEITANGTVLPQLEVISVDQREELRRELFGG